MYLYCEDKIKLLAKIMPVLYFLFFAAILPIVDCLDMSTYLLGSVAPVVLFSIILGSIGAWIGYLQGAIIYGFAEIVENAKKSAYNK